MLLMVITTRFPDELIASWSSKLSPNWSGEPLARGVQISAEGDSFFAFFWLPPFFDLWYESINDHSGVSGELGLFGEMLSKTDSPL